MTTPRAAAPDAALVPPVMPRSTAPAFVLLRRTDIDDYAVWAFEPTADQVLAPVPGKKGRFPRAWSATWIGSYFLCWSDQKTQNPNPNAPTPYYDYRLLPWDAGATDPLNATPLQMGEWPKAKFWGRFADFGNPDGGHKQYDTDKQLVLLPLGTFLLNLILDDGRGTFGVWNFDPAPTKPIVSDPVPGQYPYTAQGAFRDIQRGHELHALNGYVLDREVATGRFRLWSFDPQAIIPLAHPAVREGTWGPIGPEQQMVTIGDHVLAWNPATRAYRLWRVDVDAADPLVGPVRSGTLPAAFGPTTTLTAFQPPVPVRSALAARPGTVDFMRTKIKHVVYYMLENRSFDHVVGWLYDKGANVRVIGPSGPYDGVSTAMSNVDGTGNPVFVSQYKGGKLSNDWSLEMFEFDPYHDMSDTLRQMFFANKQGYQQGAVPDMGGFVVNNSSPTVMQTYAPAQLPVLNGIARSYAISDRWFSSMPAATDVNRAFAVSGSAQQQLNNFMSPPQYDYWPEQPHRASIWKTLWANGITDWCIYNSTLWMDHVFTYELFLMGQIPTVDADASKHVAPIDTFYAQAQAGTLPAFCYLEPVWIGNAGTSSYHPGEDLIPGEVELNKIYDALRTGPDWDETLLIVTFDEHGGIFDHVPPPRARNPWPNDVVDGFRYDMMGVRVPTIIASPWVDENTVFRSTTHVDYEGTSFLATLFHWFGIPRERWFLGERADHAPTFEGVLTRATPRTDSPAFTPPYDKNFPRGGPPTPTTGVHHLHEHVAHVLVSALMRGKATAKEITETSHRIQQEACDLPTLTRLLHELRERMRT